MTIITLARTEERDSYNMPDTMIYHEYRVSLLTNAERNQHARIYGENRLYSMNEAWAFEKGLIWKQNGKVIKESWDVFDWQDSAEKAAKGSADYAYLTAQSLHYMHQNAVKYYFDINTLRTKIDGLEHAVRSLGSKYNDLYTATLKKKRLFSKAQKNAAPQTVIDQIKAELSRQYNAEKITLQEQLTTAQTALKEITL